MINKCFLKHFCVIQQYIIFGRGVCVHVWGVGVVYSSLVIYVLAVSLIRVQIISHKKFSEVGQHHFCAFAFSVSVCLF